MYYLDPFRAFDKIMRPRSYLYSRLTGKKVSYAEYLRLYRDEGEKHLDNEPDDFTAWLDAVNDTDVRLSAMEHETDTPRYFITDSGLIDFLTNMPIKSLSYLKENWSEIRFYVYLPKTTYYCEGVTYDKSTKRYLAIAENERRTLGFPIEDFNKPDLVFKTMKETARKEMELHPSQKNEIKANKIHATEMYKLCINTLFYTLAFPEAIKRGCPTNIALDQQREFKQKKLNTIVIGVDERVLKRDGVTPHFRSGYFRHYESDRYVNMKGQIQFIEATFVKGKAYQVEKLQKNLLKGIDTHPIKNI